MKFVPHPQYSSLGSEMMESVTRGRSPFAKTDIEPLLVRTRVAPDPEKLVLIPYEPPPPREPESSGFGTVILVGVILLAVGGGYYWYSHRAE